MDRCLSCGHEISRSPTGDWCNQCGWCYPGYWCRRCGRIWVKDEHFDKMGKPCTHKPDDLAEPSKENDFKAGDEYFGAKEGS